MTTDTADSAPGEISLRESVCDVGRQTSSLYNVILYFIILVLIQVLSRAFRNRFVELHFDEIPSRELETILHQRCAIPMSYSQKMVAVMLDLQVRHNLNSTKLGYSI